MELKNNDSQGHIFDFIYFFFLHKVFFLFITKVIGKGESQQINCLQRSDIRRHFLKLIFIYIYIYIYINNVQISASFKNAGQIKS